MGASEPRLMCRYSVRRGFLKKITRKMSHKHLDTVFLYITELKVEPPQREMNIAFVLKGGVAKH